MQVIENRAANAVVWTSAQNSLKGSARKGDHAVTVDNDDEVVRVRRDCLKALFVVA